ncbi:MAG: hypothetical protein ISR75_01915 [Phycisphaerales bacterium]|nr:hypothetical protein [Planctomycetota bacterium]MBL6997178.1 hypothetical protein [Phycisphaerales bacterium]
MDELNVWKNGRTLLLGEVLVEQGLLTEVDVQSILEQQQESGRPFGEIAEKLCNVSTEAIEEAWAYQYAYNAPTIDPVTFIPRTEARSFVTHRQAWQFRCLPMNLEGDTLVLATTPRYLQRALKFATRILDRPAYFMMTTEARLAAALSEYYPLGGMSAANATNDTMKRLVHKMRIDRLREAG